ERGTNPDLCCRFAGAAALGASFGALPSPPGALATLRALARQIVNCLPIPGGLSGQVIQAQAAVVVGHRPRDGGITPLLGSLQQAPEPVTAEHPQRELPGSPLRTFSTTYT